MTLPRAIKSIKINYKWRKHNLAYKKKREYQVMSSLVYDARSYSYAQ